MTNPLQSDGFRNLSLLLARLALGTYFLLAGYGKFAEGINHWATKHATDIPRWLPTPAGKTYLYLVPEVELLAGVALVVGFFTRTSATLIALMLISFMIAREPHLGFQGDYPMQINPNLAFLGLALMLMSTGGGQIAVDASMGGGGGAPGPKKK